MIPDLKPYPAMKDFGVDTLGAVPAHWEVTRLGRLGRLFKGRGASKEDEAPTGIPCIRYGDLYTRHSYFIHDSRAFIAEERANDYTPIEYGDVLFAASGETIDEIGKSAVNLIKGEAYCGGDVIIFRPSQRIDSRYMGYVTDFRPAAIQKARMGRGFTVIHIYGDELKRLAMPLPPVPEQAAIARFLDHADRRIQRYLHARQKLIALLEEQKQASIDQAVMGQSGPRTEALHPAYRDSQVSGLGSIPKHWRLVRLKDAAQVQTGLTLGKDYRKSATVTRQYLRVANVQHGRLDLREVKEIDVPLNEARSTTLLNGDVLMTEGGDIDKLGRGCLWQDEIPDCLHQNHIFAVRCNRELLIPEFLVALMRSQHGRAYFQRTAKRTTNLASTNSTTLRAFPIPLPPVDEQRYMLAKVSRETQTLETAIRRTERGTELMREYRACVIADVVTGKLDVRAAAAALPEELDEPDAAEGDCPGAAGRDDARGDLDRRSVVPATQEEMTS